MDWLTPREYEGSALARLPEGDPRRRIDRALAAELLSAAALLELLADLVLVPLKEFLAKTAHRDQLGLLVERVVLIPIGARPTRSGASPSGDPYRLGALHGTGTSACPALLLLPLTLSLCLMVSLSRGQAPCVFVRTLLLQPAVGEHTLTAMEPVASLRS